MAKYFPFGENEHACTGALNDMWYKTVPFRKWTSRALPSIYQLYPASLSVYIPSSNDNSKFPSGERAIQEIFFLFSYDNVLDLLLFHQLSSPLKMRSATYLTRSKTDTRLPTGDRTEFPSGVNTTFPCLYTVPHKFWNL